jgi:hypothetical protein
MLYRTAEVLVMASNSILSLINFLQHAEEASTDAPSLATVVEELKKFHCPLFSFGQTVWWDEPMKLVLLSHMHQHGIRLPFVFSIHDVDYFSKLRRVLLGGEEFLIVSRNDGTTANLWASGCETAILFGSEAVPTVNDYNRCGIPLIELARSCSSDVSDFVDKWTEAWGWKALAHNSIRGPVSAFVRLGNLVKSMKELLDWAVKNTIKMIEGFTNTHLETANSFLSMVDRCIEGVGLNAHLSDFYEEVYKGIAGMLLGFVPSQLKTTTSFRFFNFNSRTCMRKRFKPVDIFISPSTRQLATEAYDEIAPTIGAWKLGEFGYGALPFELVSKDFGRGTVCVDGSWLIIKTPTRKIEAKSNEPLASREALAKLIEDSFGGECALIGKALVTPLMLCSEGIMVLSETGSAYMDLTKQLVAKLKDAGIRMSLQPLLRLCYSTFDAMRNSDFKLILPKHIARFIGKEVLSASEFADAWHEGVIEARRLVEKMCMSLSLSSTFELLRLYDGQAEHAEVDSLKSEFEDTSTQLHELGTELSELIQKCRALRNEERKLTQELIHMERHASELKRTIARLSECRFASGEEALKEERTSALEKLRQIRNMLNSLRSQRHRLFQQLLQTAYSERAEELRRRRKEQTHELQFRRLSVAREALLTAVVPYSHFRPCAWWLPIVDPSGKWWCSVRKLARARFEAW